MDWHNKPLEWLVTVGVITVYLIVRSTELSWWERIILGLLPAGLAYGLSEIVATKIGIDEVFAAILIMLMGPGILGALMTAGRDEDWLTSLLRGYVKKRFGLQEKSDE